MRRLLLLFSVTLFTINVWGQLNTPNGTVSSTTNPTTGNVGIGTTSPNQKLHITDSKRMGIRLGGPTNSSGAVADLYFRPSDDGLIGGARFWNWSFRTDSWSSAPGDFVLYSHNGSNYISPIIFQTDGDVALVSGNNAGRCGNVGIGTTSPDEKLHVYGNVSIYNENGQGNGFGTDANGNFIIYRNAVSNNTKSLVINDGNGNIGIGTTDPNYKLSVNGTIGAKEVIVTNDGWADFVFEPDYNLMPLQELDTYIQENKHLPEIPTTEEVKENGISVGEMNAKLLQKIEELTLYTLEQEKTINNQQEMIKDLLDRVEKLEIK